MGSFGFVVKTISGFVINNKKNKKFWYGCGFSLCERENPIQNYDQTV